LLVVVNGFSISGVGGSATGPSVPLESISIDERMNDPLPTATFDILDPGSQSTYTVCMDVTVWDENAPPLSSTVATVPAHNILGKATDFTNNSYWVPTGTLSGLINTGAVTSFSMTFSNSTNGASGYLAQTTQLGYCHAGQTYMLSAYLTIGSSLVGANMFLKIQFLNASFTQVGSITTFTRSATTSNVRESIQATAPTNAVYIVAQIGGQTTSGTNSGTGTWATPQLEPMWFVNEGISYPTPDCTYAVANCAQCADNTVSRACRLFAGYINDLSVTYDGPNRTWHVSCVGPGAVLENSLVSHSGGTFSDSTIINDTISNYFVYEGFAPGAPVFTLIGTQPVNSFAPTPVQTIVSSVTGQWTDISFRSMLNDLVGVSGGQYYMDWYYNLYYQPIYNQTASFTLSDAPDGVHSFAYSNYKLQYDGTQLKTQVKVVGDSSSHVAQVDGQNTPQVNAPPYVIPSFQTIVTDSNLTSVAACTSRGLAELAQYGQPRTLIKLTAQHYTPAGTVIQFTSAKDGITNEGFVVQAVKGRCLGNGINEFDYDLGAYNPTIIDHLRKLTKTVSQPTQTTTTTPGATDLAFYETLFYGESPITFTSYTTNPGNYGAGHYGSTSWS
jgi:hypothetical protein